MHTVYRMQSCKCHEAEKLHPEMHKSWEIGMRMSEDKMNDKYVSHFINFNIGTEWENMQQNNITNIRQFRYLKQNIVWVAYENGNR